MALTAIRSTTTPRRVSRQPHTLPYLLVYVRYCASSCALCVRSSPNVALESIHCTMRQGLSSDARRAMGTCMTKQWDDCMFTRALGQWLQCWCVLHSHATTICLQVKGINQLGLWWGVR